MSGTDCQDSWVVAKPRGEDPGALPPTVRVLRSIPEVEEMRAVWTGMRPHPNADIDLFLNVIRSRPKMVRPHVPVLCKNGTPAALVIGRFEDSHVEFKIGYADFFRPKARMLTFIYGGLLGHPGADDCEALAHEVMNSLRHGEADAAFFNHLRADGPLYRALMRLSGFWGRDHFPAVQTHRSMSLPGSAEEFWARLSPKVRKNQRWQAKKLLSNHPGGVRIECFRQVSELERMIQDVEQIARKTYQRGLGVGFTDNEDTRQRLHLKAEKGWLRGYVLYTGDSPCAFWLGTLYHQEFHSDFMGYDPDHGKYSPGMYLIVQVVEDFCKRSGEEGIAAIDFGLGDAQYKEILGDVQWQDASAY
ncbi:MAG TPA: GNAT family N-acetyltransferase, partial [Terriglobales bacterium]